MASFVLLLAALALAVAFGAQYGFGMVPCELCLWERWPYRVVIVLAAAALFMPPALRRLLLWASTVTLLLGAAIAFLHVGVEQQWWPSPLPECNASNLFTGSVSSLIARLPATPAKPCDAPIFLIPGLPLSFAGMDFIAAAVGAAGLGAYLGRTTGRRGRGGWHGYERHRGQHG
jgi:disulfide bond formation protein DsbB